MDVRLLSLPMFLYNLSDSTEGKWKAEIFKEGTGCSRQDPGLFFWEADILAWTAHSVLLSVLRQAGMNCLGLYVTKVLIERLLLKDQSVRIFRDFSWYVWAQVSLSVDWKLEKKWFLSKDANWSAILWCYFFFIFTYSASIFFNYPLWTKHKG